MNILYRKVFEICIECCEDQRNIYLNFPLSNSDFCSSDAGGEKRKRRYFLGGLLRTRSFLNRTVEWNSWSNVWPFLFRFSFRFYIVKMVQNGAGADVNVWQKAHKRTVSSSVSIVRKRWGWEENRLYIKFWQYFFLN